MAPGGTPGPEDVSAAVGVADACEDVVDVGANVVLAILDVVVVVEVPTKTAAFFLMSLNLAGRKSSLGQLPLAQGFCAQHPINGGFVPEHEYHKTSGSSPTHAWAGILS